MDGLAGTVPPAPTFEREDVTPEDYKELTVVLTELLWLAWQESVRVEREADAAISEAIAEAEGMARSEQRGGNIVKENWWRGKLTGLRAAQAMRSNV